MEVNENSEAETMETPAFSFFFFFFCKTYSFAELQMRVEGSFPRDFWKEFNLVKLAPAFH